MWKKGKGGEFIMNKEQLDDIEEKLKKLPMIEIEYLRDWLMNHYPIIGMAHDIGTIIITIDGVDAEYNDINKLLLNIHDHSQWEIDEELYLEDERNGCFKIIQIENGVDALTDKEREYFWDLLEKRYPDYWESKVFYQCIHGTSDIKGHPTVDDILSILEHIKSLNLS